MVRYLEQTTPFPTQKNESQQPLIIQYPDLVDAIQLSVARQIGIPGALEAQSLEKVLVTATEEEKDPRLALDPACSDRPHRDRRDSATERDKGRLITRLCFAHRRNRNG